MCSAAETIVPARGKAMVPTDLSIDIPPGTYGRIGKYIYIMHAHMLLSERVCYYISKTDVWLLVSDVVFSHNSRKIESVMA